jgi:flavin-binding protein dodecin
LTPDSVTAGARAYGRASLLPKKGCLKMSIARVTEISSTSKVSFEDAVKHGVERANQTLRNVTSAWVKEQRVSVEKGAISHYQVNLMVTFILDD